MTHSTLAMAGSNQALELVTKSEGKMLLLGVKFYLRHIPRLNNFPK